MTKIKIKLLDILDMYVMFLWPCFPFNLIKLFVYAHKSVPSVGHSVSQSLSQSMCVWRLRESCCLELVRGQGFLCGSQIYVNTS